MKPNRCPSYKFVRYVHFRWPFSFFCCFCLIRFVFLGGGRHTFARLFELVFPEHKRMGRMMGGLTRPDVKT